METIPASVLFETFVDFQIWNIKQICRVNKWFNTIFSNDVFWAMKIANDYTRQPIILPTSTWKDLFKQLKLNKYYIVKCKYGTLQVISAVSVEELDGMITLLWVVLQPVKDYWDVEEDKFFKWRIIEHKDERMEEDEKDDFESTKSLSEYIADHSSDFRVASSDSYTFELPKYTDMKSTEDYLLFEIGVQKHPLIDYFRNESDLPKHTDKTQTEDYLLETTDGNQIRLQNHLLIIATPDRQSWFIATYESSDFVGGIKRGCQLLNLDFDLYVQVVK